MGAKRLRVADAGRATVQAAAAQTRADPSFSSTERALMQCTMAVDTYQRCVK
jgi:hypothetical protein